MYSIDLRDMNPDLADERRNVQFNAAAMTNFIWGSERKATRRREIAKFVESNPVYNDPIDITFMTREQRFENAARKAAAMFHEKTGFPVENADEWLYFRAFAMPNDISPFELHLMASLPYVQAQADEEQSDTWTPQFFARALNSAYAQTELGHGSNLRQLETTATYDAGKQEFVINSPTLTSVKWWAGNMGKSCNYAVVMAQLFTQGQRRGVHAFIVPIRDPETHKVLPGVHLGDIGPKFGMPANDNGFARFTNVRVPRENMLMRHAKVLADGTYVPPVHQKLSYGGMVFIRANMILLISYSLERACTIAVRYSCVRRQGDQLDTSDGKSGRHLENKLLDYQTQQYRLFPELAKAFAARIMGHHMRSMYAKISKELHKGDVTNLAQLHSLSAGLKAIITRDAAMGIEICRLSCGGHGYSMASGLPEIYADTVAGCTYEGDNIILLLQTARGLIKEAKVGPTKRPATKTNFPAVLSLSDMVQAYHAVAKSLLDETAQILTNLEQRGYTAEQAWDNSTVELCRTAKASVRAYILETFANTASSQSDSSVRRALTLLCELYAVCGIQARTGDFMEHANFSKSHIRFIRDRCCQLLSAIRPLAVQLVDAFEFQDRELHSVLGRYDGNVYENLFEWAQKSPLNRVEVPTTFSKYVGPVMRDGRSKL